MIRIGGLTDTQISSKPATVLNKNLMNEKIKYFAYVRKSTEGEERQALSIESQKDKVKEIHPNLDIVDILEEKHSAFKPYNRPVFEDMIRRIRLGEATGIIAWHPDRLSRNEIDASTITYLVRTGVIHDLKFGSYNFDNSPEGIMMLQLALSQSQYFSSKLAKDVKRGLEKKASMGWLPGVAPEGYLNDSHAEKGQRVIFVDKQRFTLLRRAFDLFLTGRYTAPEVLNKLNNEWGYIARKKKKMGGSPLARSSWYQILNNPFYAGIVRYSGKESKGQHKPLITIDEYNRVQELLGQNGNHKRPQKGNFTFSGMFLCKECGSAVTAEHKSKYIKGKNEVRGYDYYHCTHHKKNIICKQGSVEENDIHKEIKGTLKKLEMHPKFLEWALERLDNHKDEKKISDNEIKQNQESKIKGLEKELTGLRSMRAKDLITDEDFLKDQSVIKKQIVDLSKDNRNEMGEKEKIELSKKTFTFSAYAFRDYLQSDKNGKRGMLAELGSNRQIHDKKVLISLYNWIKPLYDNVDLFNANLARLEPEKFGYDYTKNEALNTLRLAWFRDLDSNQDK